MLSGGVHVQNYFSASTWLPEVGVEYAVFDVRINTMRILSLWVMQLDPYTCVIAF